MGRIAVLGAVLASACLAVGLASAGTSKAGVVKVGDGVLAPGTIVVVVGGSVTWQDIGKKPHAVASKTRSWAPFSVTPGGRHTVKFPRAGAYRYVVDGKLPGLVVVGGGGFGKNGSGGSPATNGKWKGTISSDGIVSGKQSCGGFWKGTLSLTISGGRLRGSGEADEAGKLYCTVKLPSPELSHVTFTVDGTSTASPSKAVPEFLIHMHPLTVTPVGGYDAAGFLLHFGSRGEGFPIVLVQYAPDRIGTFTYLVRQIESTSISLADDIELAPAK